MELSERNIQQIEDIFERKHAEKNKSERERQDKFEARIYEMFDKLGERIEKSQDKGLSQTKEYFSQEIKIIAQNSKAERDLIIQKQNDFENKFSLFNDELCKKARKEDIETAINTLKFRLAVTILALIGGSFLTAWQYLIPKMIDSILKTKGVT